jgi:tetratricopeptide (TPR) repeat protein
VKTFDEVAGKVPWVESWTLLEQLAEALAWLHGQGLVHAGLSGGNALVVPQEEGTRRAMLTDVGQAWLGEVAMARLHDQAAYISPERWRDPAGVLEEGQGEAWDVYAFGVLAWRFLHGRWPRAGKLFDQVLASREESLTVDPAAFAEWLGEEPPPVWPSKARGTARREVRELLLKCLSLDPAERPASMQEVAEGLRQRLPVLAVAEATPPPVALTPMASTAVVLSPFVEAPERAAVSEMSAAPKAPPAAVEMDPDQDLLPEASVVAPLPPEVQDIVLTDSTAPPAEVRTLPSEGFRPIFEEVPAEPEGHPVKERAALPSPVELPAARTVFTESSSRLPVERKPDYSQVFTAPVPAAVSNSGPDTGGVRAPAEQGADLFLEVPEIREEQPVLRTTPELSKVKEMSGAGRRLAVAAVVLVGLAGGFFGMQQMQAGESRAVEAGKFKAEAGAAEKEAAALKQHAEALEAELKAMRLSRLSGPRAEWSLMVSGLLENVPKDGAALEAWKGLAGPIADRLKAALALADEEPSLMSGSMEPRWQLSGLLVALGRDQEALPLLEHVARDLEMATVNGAPLDASGKILSVRVAAQRGELLMRQGKAMEALPLLETASNGYEALLTTDPGRHDFARAFAENSLREGRALRDRAKPNESRMALGRVAGLLGRPGDEGFEAEDHFTLTDSLTELSALNEAEGKLDQAIENHMQAIPMLVAYDRENRLSVPCRRRLSDCYFTLGTLLTKNGTPRDASIAFSEAVKILDELSAETPGEASYRLKLSLTYNEVSQLIKSTKPNAAGAKEALVYQNGSVTILRNLNENNTLDNVYRRHLATALVLNGELNEAAGEPKTGVARQKEALSLLDELLAGADLGEAERRDCRRLSARAWTALGSMQEKAGSKDEAIASLSKALEAWTGFAEEDPIAETNVASTRERLRKLKPGS